jgi:hypothetical protein
MEVPKSGVGSVIEARGRTLGKEIWDEAIVDAVCEAAQNILGLPVTARRESETLQRDHCVAAPIGEPMVAGNDTAHLVSDSMGANLVYSTTDWGNEELVSGKHEFGRNALLRWPGRHLQKTTPPFGFKAEYLCRSEGLNVFPRIGGNNQGCGLVHAEVCGESSR